MADYNFHAVNQIGCKWSVKTGNKLVLAERKPCVVHFRERPEKAVLIEVSGSGFVKVDSETFQALVTKDITQASLFRVHSDPFGAAIDGKSFELLNFPTRRWLRHSSFMLRADPAGVGTSFPLDATFFDRRPKKIPVQPVKATVPAPSPVAAPSVRMTPKTPKNEDEQRPSLASTGTPAKPARKRPAPPPEPQVDEDGYLLFKSKIAKLQNSVDNWV
jgi:hypothetical protein